MNCWDRCQPNDTDCLLLCDELTDPTNSECYDYFDCNIHCSNSSECDVFDQPEIENLSDTEFDEYLQELEDLEIILDLNDGYQIEIQLEDFATGEESITQIFKNTTFQSLSSS